MKRALILLFTFGLVLAAARASEAATFCVDDTGDGPANAADCAATCDGTNDCSLRDAVQAANASFGTADEILLEAATYTLSQVGSEGLPVLDELTVTGTGSTETTIDGNGFVTSGRVFTVSAGDKLTLSGLTLTNGRDEIDSGGGGIFADGAELTLTDVTISENFSTADGGGLFLLDGSLTATDVRFADNIADSDAGGGTLGSGGGLDVHGSVVVSLTRATFFSNEAFSGGGLNASLSGGTLIVADSSFVDNTAAVGGGGLQTYGDGVIEGSTFRGNYASFGGGVFSNVGDFTFRNTTLSGNVASFSGGALRVFNGANVSLNNVTIAANNASNGVDAGEGGGVSVDASGVLTMRNTILAGNYDFEADAPDCSGAVASAGHNLLGSETGCTFASATGDLIGVAPLLNELADNGGLTDTQLLLEGSLALDAGDDDCEVKDQRGEDRPKDGNGDGTAACDIGAVEMPTGSGGTTGGTTGSGTTGGGTTEGATTGSDGGQESGGCSLIR